jgi:gliding motility-associated lipoprotein GldB
MKKLVMVVVVLFMITSCGKNKFDVDVSDIEVNIEINRLDRDLFLLNPDSLDAQLPAIKQKYGDFFELYCKRVLSLGSSDNPAFTGYLALFLTDYTMALAYDEVQTVFPDLNQITEELNDAFRHYKYYFPEKNIPKIYTCISGFNESLVVTDNTLGIALDKYLGIDCDLYDRIRLNNYTKYKMHKDKIVTDCMYGWATTEFPYVAETDNLLSQMIYYGKIQYFVDAMCPQQPDTLKWGYTLQQYSWAEEFENKVYEYMVEKKLLFSTETMDITTFIADGPFTNPFSDNSAPRAGVWVGWKIVHSYMDNNKEVTLAQLMQNTNYQDIFNRSKYVP